MEAVKNVKMLARYNFSRLISNPPLGAKPDVTTRFSTKTSNPINFNANYCY